MVDLAGRLSNPREAVDTLPDQGWSDPTAPPGAADQSSEAPIATAASGPLDQRGRLSNPVQRRLSELDVDDLVRDYMDGSSIGSLAMKLGVNRTTIIHHLDRRDVERRKSVRKMTDRSVRQAAKRYESGESLKIVAARFAVDARTLAREFRRADVPIRPRRARPPS
jgi:hypothetical protein